jgi:hypothetical protein
MKKIMNEFCEENANLRHQLKAAETIMLRSGNSSLLPSVTKSRPERRRQQAFLKKSIDDLQLHANRGNKSELSVALKEVRNIYDTIQVEEKAKEKLMNNDKRQERRRLSREPSFQLPFPLQRMSSTSTPTSRVTSPELSRRSSTTSFSSPSSSFLSPLNRYSSLKSSPSTLTTLTIIEGGEGRGAATDEEELTPKATVIPNTALKKDYRIELFKKLKPPPKSPLDSEMTVKFSNLIDHHSTSSHPVSVSVMSATLSSQSKSLNPLVPPIQTPPKSSPAYKKKKRSHLRRYSN